MEQLMNDSTNDDRITVNDMGLISHRISLRCINHSIMMRPVSTQPNHLGKMAILAGGIKGSPQSIGHARQYVDVLLSEDDFLSDAKKLPPLAYADLILRLTPEGYDTLLDKGYLMEYCAGLEYDNKHIGQFIEDLVLRAGPRFKSAV